MWRIAALCYHMFRQMINTPLLSWGCRFSGHFMRFSWKLNMHMQITPETLSVAKPLARQPRAGAFRFCAKDQNQFFPFFTREPAAFRIVSIRLSKNYDHWEGFLKEFRPTILVSAGPLAGCPTRFCIPMHSSPLPMHTTGTVANLVGREFLVEGES